MTGEGGNVTDMLFGLVYGEHGFACLHYELTKWASTFELGSQRPVD